VTKSMWLVKFFKLS